MSILIDRNTTITPQGMSGAIGTFPTLEGLSHGTEMVGGVTPDNHGESHLDWPANSMMAKAILATIHAEGISTNGMIRIGAMPDSIFKRGDTGVASRSGALAYEVMLQTSCFGQTAMEATDSTVHPSPSFWANSLRKRPKSQ